MVMNQTGANAEAMLRHLKDNGFDVSTRAQCRAAVKASTSAVETGLVTIENPKRPGQLMTHAWLHVEDARDAMTVMVQRLVDAGIFNNPPNVPHDKIWIVVGVDKGGGSTKMIAKFVNAEQSDSWRHTALLACLDKLEDCHYFLDMCWGKLFAQLRRITMFGDFNISTPWAPRIPSHLEMTSDWQVRRRPRRIAPYKVQARLHG